MLHADGDGVGPRRSLPFFILFRAQSGNLAHRCEKRAPAFWKKCDHCRGCFLCALGKKVYNQSIINARRFGAERGKRRMSQLAIRRAAARRLYKAVRKNAVLYLLLLVPIAYILIFHYYPMYGAQIAFRSYSFKKGITGSPWVGLKYFRQFLTNYTFRRVITNTLSISLYAIAAFPIPVILALLVHYMPSRGLRRTVQMVSYAPHFISTVVMVGIIMQFFAARDGLINNLLLAMGLQSVDFLGNPDHFYGLYVWTGVWQTMGYNSIIYISSLSGIDPGLHEAAKIDGASLLKRIWHIDLPGIVPIVTTMFILRCGSILSLGYEKVYLLQNTLNISASEVISTYVYKQGLTAAIPQYSYSTAVGLFVSVVNILMLTLVNTLSRRLVKASLW